MRENFRGQIKNPDELRQPHHRQYVKKSKSESERARARGLLENEEPSAMVEEKKGTDVGMTAKIRDLVSKEAVEKWLKYLR
ncbi:hypothetical protein MLD38_032938 [Melastoma candidum]|uniref:Uncharacterized protein n=1 Tax=Melastoma candidum TaxID=119954 RepID=A0ACB9M5A6_9MYRT|nr:hypothetical protein MLD38_032938 [Melastoma candidum]